MIQQQNKQTTINLRTNDFEQQAKQLLHLGSSEVRSCKSERFCDMGESWLSLFGSNVDQGGAEISCIGALSAWG